MGIMDIKLSPASGRLVQRLEKAGKIDLRPTLRVIGIGYRKEVDLIFSKQQPRAEGLRWPELSPAYAAWKAKNYPGYPMLVRTGSLLASMTQEGAPGNITAISKTQAVFGSSVYYGVYHDSDGARRSNLPRRNFSEPSDRRRQIWLDQIEANIRENFTREGIVVQGDILK